MFLQSLLNWSKRSPVPLFACQGRTNAHLGRHLLYLRGKGSTEGAIHRMGPFSLPFTPSGTGLRHGWYAGPLLGSRVENMSGDKCLQTLYTPQAEGKAACHAAVGYCPSRVRAKTFLLH